MTTRTKEEQQLLDEKIARIQKKNEEILKRQKEIEEDKRLAEQHNAIVKLRPSSVNVSRERTPALKPSNRELREEFTEDICDSGPVIQRNTRGNFRARGVERYRGQGDWKATGPPPDPKSFLHDDERDAPPKDRDGKGDQRRESYRGRRGDERDNREEFYGGREFQRGGRRGGVDQRVDRGRRGGRGRSTRSEEDAWRAERMRIDEARIQRQKAADGKWRREWDNEKIMQEPIEETRYESRRSNSGNQEHWRPSIQHHSQMHIPPDNSPRGYRGGGARGGRGRGRLEPAELEMPLDKFQVEVLQKQISPIVKSSGFDFPEKISPLPSPLSPPLQDKLEFKLDPVRSIECVGNTVKISIPNTLAVQSTVKPQRQGNESRGRYKSHTSCSSQSDDDSPRDRGYRSGRRQRNQKSQKSQAKNEFHPKIPLNDNSLPTSKQDILPAQNKPPLPPFRSDQVFKTTSESKTGDESWEDVTTSGTESMGEELSSVNSSPLKNVIVNSVTVNSRNQVETESESLSDITPNEFLEVETSNYSLDEYLNQISITSASENLENEAKIGISSLLKEGNNPILKHCDVDSADIKLLRNVTHDIFTSVPKVNSASEGAYGGSEIFNLENSSGNLDMTNIQQTSANQISIGDIQTSIGPESEYSPKVATNNQENIETNKEKTSHAEENLSENEDNNPAAKDISLLVEDDDLITKQQTSFCSSEGNGAKSSDHEEEITKDLNVSALSNVEQVKSNEGYILDSNS